MTFLKMRKSFCRGWSWTTGRGASVLRLVVQCVAFVLDISCNKFNFQSYSRLIAFGFITSYLYSWPEHSTCRETLDGQQLYP